jgi:hypothetical protein
MARIDMRYLRQTLALRHATMVEDGRELARLVKTEGAAGPPVYGCISRRGRVVGYHLPTGESVLREDEIEVHVDARGGIDWEPAGDPRVYRVDADDEGVVADGRRLFLAQSLRLGAVDRLAGWRGRVVALVPEEVGPKESNVIRTLADGRIEVRHTYHSFDASAQYAEWVHSLAMEFSGTDEAIGARPEPSAFEALGVSRIVQAWLVREANEAEREHARFQLEVHLGAHAMMAQTVSQCPMTVAELARSLYTDRPNLTRLAKAGKDKIVLMEKELQDQEARSSGSSGSSVGNRVGL